MTVFELARRAGVSPATVRLYRRSRMLRAPHPLPAGGHGYDDTDAALLRAIVGLHRLGVSPATIARPANGTANGAARDPDEAIRSIRRVLERQQRSVARKSSRLDELDACLAAVATLLAPPAGGGTGATALDAQRTAGEER